MQPIQGLQHQIQQPSALCGPLQVPQAQTGSAALLLVQPPSPADLSLTRPSAVANKHSAGMAHALSSQGALSQGWNLGFGQGMQMLAGLSRIASLEEPVIQSAKSALPQLLQEASHPLGQGSTVYTVTV